MRTENFLAGTGVALASTTVYALSYQTCSSEIPIVATLLTLVCLGLLVSVTSLFS